jgi:ankyrin
LLIFGLLAGALATASWAVSSDSRLADAAQNQNKTLIRSLLKAHADANGLQPDRTTALMWSAHFNDSETVALLLSAGANANLVNRYGVSAITEAADNFAGSTAVLKALLKAGADPNTVAANNESVLMTLSLSGAVDAVRLLLEHGADVNAHNAQEQETPLMYATAEKSTDVMKLLIAKGADVNAVAHTLEMSRGHSNDDKPIGGFTALMFAARQDCAECARILLDAGANLRVQDRDGMTPMIIATMNGGFETAELILERGGDPNDGVLWELMEARNFEDDTHTIPINPSKLDALSFEKRLLDKGADPTKPYGKIHTVDRRGGTIGTRITSTSPLERAVRAVDVESIRLMLDHAVAAGNKFDPETLLPAVIRAYSVVGPTIRLGSGEERAKLAFRTVTVRELADAVAVSIAHGANVNAANNQGVTPLHLAAQLGADDTVKLLVDRGAKINVKTKGGLTPIDYALGKGGPPQRNRGEDEFDPVVAQVYESTAALLRKLASQAAPGIAALQR